MEQKLQIFISSTKLDLDEERRLVSLAILRSSHIPAGMEISSGINDSTLSVLYKWIDACNLFVLILGGRYGAVSPSHGLSYTHLELLYARRKRIPVIVVLLTDDYLNAKVSAGQIKATDAFDRHNAEKLLALRKDVSDERYCLPINDIREIESALYRSISEAQRTLSITGWVRREDCLALITDAYAHYIDLYLSLVTADHLEGDQIVPFLRALTRLVAAAVCPSTGWIDVVIPTKVTSKDLPHLLVDGVIKDDHWLRVIYSSVPRNSPPH